MKSKLVGCARFRFRCLELSPACSSSISPSLSLPPPAIEVKEAMSSDLPVHYVTMTSEARNISPTDLFSNDSINRDKYVL